MEPRSNERGNLLLAALVGVAQGLQWSHAQTSVETLSRMGRWQSYRLRFNGATLKRAWKLVARRRAAAAALKASMEPRSNERGNQGIESVRRRLRMLQWSHAQTSVETDRNGDLLSIPLGLQWSHAQTSVETVRRCRKSPEKERASMEPRSNERGNVGGFSSLHGSNTLQWSHAQTSVETKRVAADIVEIGGLQWSHAQTSVETARVANLWGRAS